MSDEAWPMQSPCPCNVRSSAVCAYANWHHICYGKPDLIPKTPEQVASLKHYFESRSKKRGRST